MELRRFALFYAPQMGKEEPGPNAQGADDRSAPAPGDRRRYMVVAEKILQALALGTIARGDRLPTERELAARCQVSRSTVREALLALELSGVVEVRPGSGCYLTGMGLPAWGAAASALETTPLASAPRELLAVRQLIEPPIAHACAWLIRPPDLRALETLLDNTENAGGAVEETGIERFVRLNLAFHRELAQHCGNAILASLASHLTDAGEHPLWMLVDSIAVRSARTRGAQIREHRTILTAIAEHRGNDAAQAMAAHLGAISARIFGPPRGQEATAVRPILPLQFTPAGYTRNATFLA
jgi:DNA-binding FadR family transcriptional regulator